MNYGTLTDNQLHPAPRAFMLHGAMVTNPKAEHFAALNEERAKKDLPPYLPIVDETPTTDAAHYAVATGWTRDGETWRRVYEVRANPPPPPRVWTPLAIKRACGDRWATVKAALQQADIYEDFIMAQELREDDAAFAQGYNWAVSEFGAEVVDAVLAAAEGGV